MRDLHTMGRTVYPPPEPGWPARYVSRNLAVLAPAVQRIVRGERPTTPPCARCPSGAAILLSGDARRELTPTCIAPCAAVVAQFQRPPSRPRATLRCPSAAGMSTTTTTPIQYTYSARDETILERRPQPLKSSTGCVWSQDHPANISCPVPTCRSRPPLICPAHRGAIDSCGRCRTTNGVDSKGVLAPSSHFCIHARHSCALLDAWTCPKAPGPSTYAAAAAGQHSTLGATAACNCDIPCPGQCRWNALITDVPRSPRIEWASLPPAVHSFLFGLATHGSFFPTTPMTAAWNHLA